MHFKSLSCLQIKIAAIYLFFWVKPSASLHLQFFLPFVVAQV